MSSLLQLQPVQLLQMLYSALSVSKNRDKVDMILEPLQAMIQLALLSTCPIGTKLQIQENILYVQPPTLIQPVSRWYHSDKKDDLYFLYSVIKRFIKWYHPVNNKKSPITLEMYQLISTMSVEGLQQLFKTYSSAEANTVIHVIQMYKNLLEYNNDKIMTEEYLLDMEKNKINIDEVFENIISIYDPIMLQVVYYSLQMIRAEQSTVALQHMVDGLNLILNKSNQQIRDWIRMNMVL